MGEGITLSIAWWSFLASTVLPLLVGIVTKEVAEPKVKATVLLVLSAANGLVSSAIQNQGLLTKQTVVAGLISLVVSAGTYYGFLKPSTIAPKVAAKTSDVGVG